MLTIVFVSVFLWHVFDYYCQLKFVGLCMCWHVSLTQEVIISLARHSQNSLWEVPAVSDCYNILLTRAGQSESSPPPTLPPPRQKNIWRIILSSLPNLMKEHLTLTPSVCEDKSSHLDPCTRQVMCLSASLVVGVVKTTAHLAWSKAGVSLFPPDFVEYWPGENVDL